MHEGRSDQRIGYRHIGHQAGAHAALRRQFQQRGRWPAVRAALHRKRAAIGLPAAEEGGHRRRFVRHLPVVRVGFNEGRFRQGIDGKVARFAHGIDARSGECIEAHAAADEENDVAGRRRRGNARATRGHGGGNGQCRNPETHTCSCYGKRPS